MWLAKVRETYGDNLDIDWKPFYLAQANSNEGPDWRAWEQEEDSATLGLQAFAAAEAAARQGTAGFEAFMLAMLRARHEDRKDLSDENVILESAQIAGLDMARFREDMKDPTIIPETGKSHIEAVEEHGVFGVPTFIFPNGASAFLKAYVPPDEDAVSMFEDLTDVMSKWKFIGEVKRPQPPWPKGVFA